MSQLRVSETIWCCLLWRVLYKHPQGDCIELQEHFMSCRLNISGLNNNKKFRPYLQHPNNQLNQISSGSLTAWWTYQFLLFNSVYYRLLREGFKDMQFFQFCFIQFYKHHFRFHSRRCGNCWETWTMPEKNSYVCNLLKTNETRNLYLTEFFL